MSADTFEARDAAIGAAGAGAKTIAEVAGATGIPEGRFAF